MGGNYVGTVDVEEEYWWNVVAVVFGWIARDGWRDKEAMHS